MTDALQLQLPMNLPGSNRLTLQNPPIAVRSRLVAILARSSREISQTVRIDCHSFLSRVRISVQPSKFFIDEKTQNELKLKKITTCVDRCGVYI